MCIAMVTSWEELPQHIAPTMNASGWSLAETFAAHLQTPHPSSEHMVS
jgi:hypothetical protein